MMHIRTRRTPDSIEGKIRRGYDLSTILVHNSPVGSGGPTGETISQPCKSIVWKRSIISKANGKWSHISHTSVGMEGYGEIGQNGQMQCYDTIASGTACCGIGWSVRGSSVGVSMPGITVAGGYFFNT